MHSDAENQCFRVSAGGAAATGPEFSFRRLSLTNFWRIIMRKTLAIAAATGAILFGGAGVANASGPGTQPPSSTTTVAQTGDNNNNNNHSDKTGLWGLVGLAGLAGLAGLRRRHDAHVDTGTAAPRARS
jgi:MYXO-CTERM domain-containing protein